ncbi:MAG: hypothetical protein KBT04_03845 [Bacteroidales bacterium]|nr:hypothetical protein [Candidatus Colimorpha onthohippi]
MPNGIFSVSGISVLKGFSWSAFSYADCRQAGSYCGWGCGKLCFYMPFGR